MRRWLAAAAVLGLVLSAPVAVHGAEMGQTSSPTTQTHRDKPREKVAPLPRLAQRELVRMAWPTSLAVAPDGRIFVSERLTGNIRIIKDGVLLDAPFAHLDVVTTGETGLLGIALDPEFATTGWVYVYATVCELGPGQCDSVNDPVHNDIWRFRAEGDLGVEGVKLIGVPGNALIHNAGNLAFGRDGRLYVTIGDTGMAQNAQYRWSLRGKVLRYNRDGTVPTDGPFGQSPVFALGFRNPFDITVDPFNGNILVTENGASNWDEIDLVERGKNYGWPRVRGAARKKGYTDPIWTVEKTVAPTGITVYRGSRFPDLRGALLWCGYHSGQLRGARFSDARRTRLEADQAIGRCRLDVAEGPDGRLYLADPDRIWVVE